MTRQLSVEQGLSETLPLDFELLLRVFEERAEQHMEEVQRRTQEHEERKMK